MECATVNLDRNKVVLCERAALDGQSRPCGNRIIAKANQRRALSRYVDNTTVIFNVAAFNFQEAVFALNVDDIVRGNARVLRGILRA